MNGSLHAIAVRVQSELPEADGVGVTLMVQDRPVFAGSNLFTEAVDKIQYGLGQGPCLAAVASGQVVRSRTVGAGEPRWPRFCDEAAAVELRSVASIPVRAGLDVVGSLNLYGRSAGQLDCLSDQALLRRSRTVAELASSAWLIAVATASADALARAVDDQAVVARAVGLLIDRYHISEPEARDVLQRMSTRVGYDDHAMARLLLDSDLTARERRPGAEHG